MAVTKSGCSGTALNVYSTTLLALLEHDEAQFPVGVSMLVPLFGGVTTEQSAAKETVLELRAQAKT
jgi:hypothetical protein